MTDVSTTSTSTKAPLDQKIVRRVSRVLFRISQGGELRSGDQDKRKALWEENKKSYTSQARKLLNRLAEEGISVTMQSGD